MILALVAQELRDVGSFASLGLAILVVFTNARAVTLPKWGEARILDEPEARAAVQLDRALFIATVVVVVALSPLLVDVMDELSLFRTRGVFRSLFALAWAGFVALAIYQRSIWRSRRGTYRDLFPDGRSSSKKTDLPD